MRCLLWAWRYLLRRQLRLQHWAMRLRGRKGRYLNESYTYKHERQHITHGVANKGRCLLFHWPLQIITQKKSKSQSDLRYSRNRWIFTRNSSESLNKKCPSKIYIKGGTSSVLTIFLLFIFFIYVSYIFEKYSDFVKMKNFSDLSFWNISSLF